MPQRRVSVTVDADVNPFVRSLATGSAAARTFAKDLDSADGRMASLVQTGLALAPALVPLGGLAVPALAGLANQLGATAAAAGVTLLAFQGVGDALDALNDYQIDPTEAHFKKLQETMEALGPAGQVFVRTLQDLRPELQQFQDTAQQDMFPGLTQSIRELFELAPEVDHLIGTIAGTIGDLAADAGDGLNDDRWVQFIEFLDREADPTLSAMGETLGAVVEGLASMMMAFDPLADDFTQGMVEYAQRFRDWADGLGDNEDFQDFVDYVRDNGPEAMETLGALGDALVGLVEAAAPVGSTLLPVIETLADGLASIARSPIGPILVGAAAAVGTLGRSLAILQAVGLRSGDSLLAKVFQVDKIKAGTSALLEVTSAQDRARMSTAALAEVEEKRAATARAGLAQAGRGAALIGGLALATSGYAEKTELANTATFALMGTIAGPWGAAVGAGVGLVMDFAHANDDLEKSISRANDAMDAMDPTAMQSAIEGLDDAIASTQDALDFDWSFNPLKHINEGWSYAFAEFDQLTGDTLAKAQETRDQLVETSEDIALALSVLGSSLGELEPGDNTATLEQMTTILTRAKPAMDALGISVEDLGRAAADGSIGSLTDRIAGYIQWSDTAEGRTRAVADAMAALDDDMQSTAMSAEGLSKALDELFGVGMGLSASTDQWRAGLRNLKDELDDTGRSLTAHTDAADKNRAAIRDQVDNLSQLLTAQAANGASAKDLARNLRVGRDAILDTGEAAGLSRKELGKYLNDLGLTPKVVRTIIDANTDPAKLKKRRLMAELAELDNYRATPHVDVDARQAISQMDRVRMMLDNLDGKRAQTVVETVYQQTNKPKGTPGSPDGTGADGTTIPKTGLPYADRHLYLLADGEEVVSNRNGQADRYRRALKGINADLPRETIRGMLAAGGTAGIDPQGTLGDRTAIVEAMQSIRDITRQLNERIKKGDRKGELKVGGLDRELLQLQLQAAKADLNAAKHREDREVREAAKAAKEEYDSAVGSAKESLDLGTLSAADTIAAIDAFEQAIKDAGGNVGKAFNELEDRAGKLASQYEAEQAALEKSLAYRDEIRGAAEGSFNHDIFGGSLSDLDLQLRADTNDATAMAEALQIAAGKGLDGDFAARLGGSGNLALAQELAQQDPSRIDYYERLYAGRGAAQTGLGNTVVNMSGVENAIAQSSATVATLTQRLEGIEQRIEAGVYAGALEGTSQQTRTQSRKTSNRKRAGR